MISKLVIKHLYKLFNSHGGVDHIQPLSDTVEKGCITLVVMNTMEEAYAAASHFGLPMFGLKSLIINEDWIEQHLMDH